MLSSIVSWARRRRLRASLPEVAIRGRHAPYWHQALDATAPVWAILEAEGCARPARRLFRWSRKRVVVPLMEHHIASMKNNCYALVPDAQALAILADKGRFAHHAEAVGAGHLVPRNIDIAHPTFPAILKRKNLNAGRGVALVTSQDELTEKLAGPPWNGHEVLLQEAVPAALDHVTYVVCVEGRIVWHCTYNYPLANPSEIRGPVAARTVETGSVSADDIAAFEQLLLPLHFNGPANIDYRRRPDGSLAVFEINPRLGGSLMRPAHLQDLAGCLRAIVQHARWRPRTPAATPRSGV